MQLSSLQITRLYNDVNGNKKISVKHLPTGKFFNVQIVGNIDAPTSTPLKDWTEWEETAAISSFARYMYQHGTPRQKETLKDVFFYASLSDVMRGNYTPSQAELNSLISLLSKGRRERTRNRIKSVVNYGLTSAKRYAIYDRVVFEPNGTVRYIAGQDYTAELSTVVECLTK